MSTQLTRTPSRTREFSSERAMRRGRALRRTDPLPEGRGAVSTAVPTAREAAPSPVRGARVLRRWSVAELVARAAGSPRQLA